MEALRIIAWQVQNQRVRNPNIDSGILIPDGGARTINRDSISQESVSDFTTGTSHMCLQSHLIIGAVHHHYKNCTIKLENWSVRRALVNTCNPQW
jgi:hypothetical protein